MYASLFGVRNWSNRMLPHDVERVIPVGQFRAIAPGRGAPPNASPEYERDRYVGVVGETWVLWTELAAIDWDEEGEQYVDDEPPYLVSGWPGPGRRHERRRDHLNGGWATLFKLMEVLAEQFGSDNVRLCVWFNQW